MTTSLRSLHVNGARFFLVFVCCVMSSVGVSAQLPVDSSSGGFWSDCKIPETELFERLNAIAQAVLHDGDRSHDTINAIDRALGRAWDAHRGDAVIRAAVEAASERILDEEGRTAVFWSGWSTEKANLMVATLSNYTMDSRPVRELVAILIEYAVEAVDPILTVAYERAAGAGIACLQEFARESFPSALAELFMQFLGQDSGGINMDRQHTEISVRTLLAAHSLALGSVGTVVAAQLVVRIAPLVLSKLGAAIVSATVPILGWTVGTVLLVSDVIVNRDGALGIGENILTSAEHKREMRTQLRETILAEMRRHSAAIARALSEEIYFKYKEFVKQWQFVIFWSKNNAYFRRFVDLVQVREMDKLAALVGTLERRLEFEEMNNLIDRGELETLFGLPQESYDVLTAKTPEELMEWADLAGHTILLRVVESEIYRVSDPTQFESRDHLQKVLNLELSPSDVRTVMMVGQHMETLLELPVDDAKKIVAQSRQHNDLVWLLPLLSAMSSRQTNVTVEGILRYPELLRSLESERVRKAALNSSDIGAFMDFIAQPSGLSPADRARRIMNEIDGLISGRISRELFFERYRGHILFPE